MYSLKKKRETDHKYPATVPEAFLELVMDTKNHILHSSAYVGERKLLGWGGGGRGAPYKIKF